jgi:hypothetical protein
VALQLHKSLADWLLDRRLSRHHAADLAVGHCRLGLHLAAVWREQCREQWRQLDETSWRASTGPSSSASSMSAYLFKYGIAHLAAATEGSAAGRPSGPPDSPEADEEAAARLSDLVTDLVFLAAAAKRRCLADIIVALAALRSPSPEVYDVLRVLLAVQGELTGERCGPKYVAALVIRTCPTKSEVYKRAASMVDDIWRPALSLPVERQCNSSWDDRGRAFLHTVSGGVRSVPPPPRVVHPSRLHNNPGGGGGVGWRSYLLQQRSVRCPHPHHDRPVLT